jgi:hypothetical protein
MIILAKTWHRVVLASGDLQGDLPLFMLGDKQGASPLVRNTLVAEVGAYILVPARPAWGNETSVVNELAERPDTTREFGMLQRSLWT